MTNHGKYVQINRATMRPRTIGQIALLICSKDLPLTALATEMSIAMGGVVVPMAKPMTMTTPSLGHCLRDLIKGESPPKNLCRPDDEHNQSRSHLRSHNEFVELLEIQGSVNDPPDKQGIIHGNSGNEHGSKSGDDSQSAANAPDRCLRYGKDTFRDATSS